MNNTRAFQSGGEDNVGEDQMQFDGMICGNLRYYMKSLLLYNMIQQGWQAAGGREKQPGLIIFKLAWSDTDCQAAQQLKI